MRAARASSRSVAAAGVCAAAALLGVALSSRPTQWFGVFAVLLVLVGLRAWAWRTQAHRRECGALRLENAELTDRLARRDRELECATRAGLVRLAAAGHSLRQPAQALELTAALLDPGEPPAVLASRLAALRDCAGALSAMLVGLQHGRGPIEGADDRRAPVAAATPARFAGRCVAVLEDDRLVLEGMLDMLRSWGLEAVGAADLRGLIALLANRRPDLLLVDLHLSGERSGLRSLAKLRHWLGAPLPAIVVTGDLDPLLDRIAQEQGARLVHKPLRPQRLRQLVAQSLA